MRTMYDSADPSAIPAGAQLVAGYVDGADQQVVQAWRDAFAGRFSTARQVRIAVLPTTDDGHVLDVENGDATPVSAPGWVRMRRAAGLASPACYVNRGNWAEAIQAFADQGVPEPLWWIATLDGTQLPPEGGVIACQYAGSDRSGGNFDLSAVADLWPGVDPEEEEMKLYIVAFNGAQWVVRPDFTAKAVIKDPGILQDLQATGNYQALTLDDAQMANIPTVGQGS